MSTKTDRYGHLSDEETIQENIKQTGENAVQIQIGDEIKTIELSEENASIEEIENDIRSTINGDSEGEEKLKNPISRAIRCTTTMQKACFNLYLITSPYNKKE